MLIRRTSSSSQVPFLSRLAEHYENVGASTGNNWVHLIKVTGITTRRVMSYCSIAMSDWQDNV